MTEILHQGIHKEDEKEVPKTRSMSFRDLLKDINKDFCIRTLISGKRGKMGFWKDWPGYKYAIKDRGYGQIICLIAHFRTWYYAGTTKNYCHHCHYYDKQTTHFDSGGLTEVCDKGYWLMDAN